MSDAVDTETVHEPGKVSPEGPPDDQLPELDVEARERRAAALAQIRTFGDPVLKSRASEITSFGPELEWTSAELSSAEEGCLSLPRVSVEVERPLFARVRGRDVHGQPLMVEASGLEARVLQHEIDHLDGVLMLDRTTREQRKAALGALREGTSYSPSAMEEDLEPTPAARAGN